MRKQKQEGMVCSSTIGKSGCHTKIHAISFAMGYELPLGKILWRKHTIPRRGRRHVSPARWDTYRIAATATLQKKPRITKVRVGRSQTPELSPRVFTLTLPARVNPPAHNFELGVYVFITTQKSSPMIRVGNGTPTHVEVPGQGLTS